MVYNVSMMRETTHRFVQGIQNGYQLTDDEEKHLDRLLIEGFKKHRPNSKIQFGEKGAEELRMKLLYFIGAD